MWWLTSISESLKFIVSSRVVQMPAGGTCATSVIYACLHDRGVEIVYRQRKLVIVIIECLGYI